MPFVVSGKPGTVWINIRLPSGLDTRYTAISCEPEFRTYRKRPFVLKAASSGPVPSPENAVTPSSSNRLRLSVASSMAYPLMVPAGVLVV